MQNRFEKIKREKYSEKKYFNWCCNEVEKLSFWGKMNSTFGRCYGERGSKRVEVFLD